MTTTSPEVKTDPRHRGEVGYGPRQRRIVGTFRVSSAAGYYNLYPGERVTVEDAQDGLLLVYVLAYDLFVWCLPSDIA